MKYIKSKAPSNVVVTRGEKGSNTYDYMFAFAHINLVFIANALPLFFRKESEK